MTDLARRHAALLPAFNPEVHPDIIFRGLLMGLPPVTIAEMVGITPKMLEEWIAEKPEVREQVNRALHADAEVLASTFHAALGYDALNKRPLENGPNMTAARLWLQNRLGWGNKPQKEERDLTPAEVLEELRKLEDKLTAPRRRAVIDVPPAPEADPDVDPGF